VRPRPEAPALLGGVAVKLTECLLSHFVRNWQKAIRVDVLQDKLCKFVRRFDAGKVTGLTDFLFLDHEAKNLRLRLDRSHSSRMRAILAGVLKDVV
jgi:hypothetical protein